MEGGSKRAHHPPPRRPFSTEGVRTLNIVHLPLFPMLFQFVLQIVMSQTGLTKIVALTPKYVAINKTEVSGLFKF